MTYRKKLIEVALPLEAINMESAREKSIRHGEKLKRTEDLVRFQVCSVLDGNIGVWLLGRGKRLTSLPTPFNTAIAGGSFASFSSK